MALKEKVVVLFANPYSMDNDRGGRSEGVSVSYLYGDTLACSDHANGSKGQRPAKASLAVGKMEKMLNVPGLYDGSFEMSIGSDGKPVLKLVDVDFLSFVKLEKMMPASSKPGKIVTDLV